MAFWGECDQLDKDRRAGQRPVDRTALCPVPVIQELESWLLADDRALSTYLGSNEHPLELDRIEYPEREANPKKLLSRIFKQHGKSMGYTDYIDAARLAREVCDIARLRKQSSFQALMDNVDADRI